MSLITVHRLLRRARRRILLAVALVAVVGVVVAHHGMPMDMHEMPAAAVCLAVVGTAVVAFGAAVLAVTARRGPAAVALWVPHGPPARAPRTAPVRAGPLFARLQVLRR